jgi:hypothetical protein
MKIRLMLTALALVLLTLALLPAAAVAWANGPDWGNGFGTHDWVLVQANRLAAKKHAAWVNLKVALPHTDDPDTVFHDFYYHAYDHFGGGDYGDAPKKVAEYYDKALAARKAGWNAQASRFAALMSHYYADICQPLHTDQCAAEDAMHSDYESDVDELTDAVGENRAWVQYDGYRVVRSAAGLAKRTAAASHRWYQALVDGYSYSGMNAGVFSITSGSLDRAANGLADLLVSIKKGVGG